MSLAVLTDSTTAQASPAVTFFPTSGSSTKTISVSSCWAWSVMPTVAISPEMRTHSCDFAYFKSVGIFDIEYRVWKCPGAASIWFAENRFLNNDSTGAFAPDFNFYRGLGLCKFNRNVAEADSGVQRGTLSATDD